MKRVFTDPRFAGFEVHNDGDNVFRVYEIGQGKQHEIDTFSTYSEHPERAITDDVAARRAKDYFDRMASGQMSDELMDRPEIEDRVAPPARATPPGDPYGLSASKSLDQITGDNIMTSDHVLDAYQQMRGLPDGPEKKKALERVKSMSRQLESSANELVRRLLD
jgi:hypothetical protein